jgi:pseudaminic acid cytidylyltransferase
MGARLAIIPARGGSKRIPRKNIRLFLGKPIICYSISSAIESGLFDEVMVSTDDPEIAKIARERGASVPFLRSEANSGDVAGTAEVLCEVLETYGQREGKIFQEACCIYPTAPFVTPALLLQTHKMISDLKCNTVFPVMQYSSPIQRSLRRDPRGKIEMLWPESYQKRSQDLEIVFHDAGQFYWFNVAYLLKHKKLYSDNSYGFAISELDGQDIDNPDDWLLAEMKYRLRHNL